MKASLDINGDALIF